MEIIFWFSIGFVLYTYMGYPFIIFIKSRYFPHPTLQCEILPFISVIIAVNNEEAKIARRLQNLLEQDYPPESYEIIVVSDGSTDKTNEIVSSFSSSIIKLNILSHKLGKAVALNEGIVNAVGEIVVFTDSRQKFAPNTVRQLVSNFADTTVGCVSGELIFLDNANSKIKAEMGAYWQYEKMIRKLESSSGSTVGATGAIYAIRRCLYGKLPPGTILDDVLTPMNIAKQGYRVVFDSDATAFDVVSVDIEQEWKRKVRTLAGNWQLLGFAPSLIVPWCCPLWWRFLSHKIFRLLVPFCILLIFPSSIVVEGTVYRVALLTQLALYLCAFCGFVVPKLRQHRVINITYFFIAMNLAAIVGFCYWISGRCDKTWQPAVVKK